MILIKINTQLHAIIALLSNLFGGVIYLLMTAVLAGDYAREEIRIDEPQFFADGLLVRGADETGNHVATWVVLVTIIAPSEITGFRRKIEQFKTALLKLRAVPKFNNQSMKGWIDRLTEIEQSMYIPKPPRRQIRGTFSDRSRKRCLALRKTKTF